MKSEVRAKVIAARSKEGNAQLIGILGRRGIHGVGVDTVRFRDPEDSGDLDIAVEGAGRFDWVVFTSAKGASSFFERRAKLGHRAEGPLPRLAAVGPGTAKAIESRGQRVDYVPATFTTKDLAEGLPGGKGNKVLLFRADIGSRALPEILADRGFVVTEVVAYETMSVGDPVDPSEVEGAKAILFASPSEVRGFSQRVPPETLRGLLARSRAVCIGPVTADEARSSGFSRIEVADEQTIDSLVFKTAEVLRDA